MEKWIKPIDSSDFVGTIIMDLSKAYDCLPNDHQIAIDISSPCLAYDYLITRHQWARTASTKGYPKNAWGVPQGSVSGPLQFKIFINDLFLYNLSSEICNFTDYYTICACRNYIYDIVMVLENDLCKLLE